MSLIVVKFGGTSMADTARIANAAQKVLAERQRGHQLAVVVSAMAGETNKLVDYCRQQHGQFDDAEYDAVVATGEQVTAGLLALALQQAGVAAQSFAGWQLPLLTSNAHGKARILEVQTEKLHATLAQGRVPVITGFQGITAEGRISTLGRGGSDTSAVALAAALKAARCDIYTDVDGVYTTDPRITSRARKLPRIAFEEMLEMASLGAKVLQTRSVQLAMAYRVPVQVLSSFAPEIGSDYPGTLLVDEGDVMENQVISGIAYSRDDAKITLMQVADRPGIAARIFGPLTAANVNVDMIVQNVSNDGRTTDLTFTVSKADLARAVATLQPLAAEIGFRELRQDPDVVKVSVIGMGMRSHAGVAQTMFTTLAERGINIQLISTSEIKISVLLAEEYTELAVRALHSAYGLDS